MNFPRIQIVPRQYSYSNVIHPTYTYSLRFPINLGAYLSEDPIINNNRVLINPNKNPLNWASLNLSPPYFPPPHQTSLQKPYRVPNILKPYIAPIARLTTKKPMTTERYIYKPAMPTLLSASQSNEFENQVVNSIKEHSLLINDAFQDKVRKLNIDSNNFKMFPDVANGAQNNPFQNSQSNKIHQGLNTSIRDGSEDIDVRFDQRPDTDILIQKEFELNSYPTVAPVQFSTESFNTIISSQQDELVDSANTSTLSTKSPEIPLVSTKRMMTRVEATESPTTIKNRKSENFVVSPTKSGVTQTSFTTQSKTVKINATKAPKEIEASDLLTSDVSTVLPNYDNSSKFPVTTVENDMLDNEEEGTTEFEDRIGDNVIKTLLGG